MAKKVFDIKLDEDYDLSIKDGDFEIIESTDQHQALLLLSQKGDWKQSPFISVGSDDFLLQDEDLLGLEREIQKQFELDGMQVNSLKVKSFEDIQIDAAYKDPENE